jgi:hypothetical protein
MAADDEYGEQSAGGGELNRPMHLATGWISPQATEAWTPIAGAGLAELVTFWQTPDFCTLYRLREGWDDRCPMYLFVHGCSELHLGKLRWEITQLRIRRLDQDTIEIEDRDGEIRINAYEARVMEEQKAILWAGGDECMERAIKAY